MYISRIPLLRRGVRPGGRGGSYYFKTNFLKNK